MTNAFVVNNALSNVDFLFIDGDRPVVQMNAQSIDVQSIWRHLRNAEDLRVYCVVHTDTGPVITRIPSHSVMDRFMNTAVVFNDVEGKGIIEYIPADIKKQLGMSKVAQ